MDQCQQLLLTLRIYVCICNTYTYREKHTDTEGFASAQDISATGRVDVSFTTDNETKYFKYVPSEEGNYYFYAEDGGWIEGVTAYYYDYNGNDNKLYRD